MTQPVVNSLYGVGFSSASNDISVNILSLRDPTASDVNYPVQKRWVNTTDGAEWILQTFITTNGVITATWLLLGTSGVTDQSLTANSGGAVSPISANINLLGDTTSLNITGDPSTHTLTANVILPVTSYSVLVGHTTSITGVTPGSSGQVLTSQGAAADPIWANVGFFTWVTDTSGAFVAVAKTGYILTVASIIILPGAPSNGDSILFVVDTTQQVGIFGQGTQVIRVGTDATGPPAIIYSTAIGDSLGLVYNAANTTWISFLGTMGVWATA